MCLLLFVAEPSDRLELWVGYRWLSNRKSQKVISDIHYYPEYPSGAQAPRRAGVPSQSTQGT